MGDEKYPKNDAGYKAFNFRAETCPRCGATVNAADPHGWEKHRKECPGEKPKMINEPASPEYRCVHQGQVGIGARVYYFCKNPKGVWQLTLSSSCDPARECFEKAPAPNAPSAMQSPWSDDRTGIVLPSTGDGKAGALDDSLAKYMKELIDEVREDTPNRPGEDFYAVVIARLAKRVYDLELDVHGARDAFSTCLAEKRELQAELVQLSDENEKLKAVNSEDIAPSAPTDAEIVSYLCKFMAFSSRDWGIDPVTRVIYEAIVDRKLAKNVSTGIIATT